MSDRQQLIRAIGGYVKELCYPSDQYLMEDLSRFLGRGVSSLDDLSDNEILKVYDRLSTAAALAPRQKPTA